MNAQPDMEDKRLKEARTRVKKKKEFYTHLASWAIMSVFFILINLFSNRGPGFFWAVFPIVGWGIGLAFHAIDVFGLPGIGRDWEERQLQKEIERLEDRHAAMKWHEYEKRKALGEGEALPDEEKLELPETRKAWNDSDFV